VSVDGSRRDSSPVPALRRQSDPECVQISDRKMVLSEENVWVSGQPLVRGTVIARLRIRGLAKGLLRVDPTAEIKPSTRC
jgi:hypothetical protein